MQKIITIILFVIMFTLIVLIYGFVLSRIWGVHAKYSQSNQYICVVSKVNPRAYCRVMPYLPR